jgi:hypothetical protein
MADNFKPIKSRWQWERINKSAYGTTYDPYKVYEKGKRPRIPKAEGGAKPVYEPKYQETGCKYCGEEHDYEHSKEYIRKWRVVN